MFPELRFETLEPHLGERFRLIASDGVELELILSEVKALAATTSPPDTGRTPFSLLFHGPARPWAPQQTHRLEHEVLGSLEIFLVPLGPDASGMRYEAIFT